MKKHRSDLVSNNRGAEEWKKIRALSWNGLSGELCRKESNAAQVGILDGRLRFHVVFCLTLGRVGEVNGNDHDMLKIEVWAADMYNLAIYAGVTKAGFSSQSNNHINRF